MSLPLYCLKGFYLGPRVSDGKASSYNAGDPGSSLGWEDLLEKEMATPLQYSCLENPMDREASQATVRWVPKESDTT